MNITLTKEQRTNLEKQIDSRWDEVLRMRQINPFVFVPNDVKIELKKEYIRVIKEIVFIKKAKIIHVDKYDYSFVYYNGNHTKVIIICPEHGEFLCTPANHLSKKSGCPKCAGKGLSTEEWIQRFREVHGNRYNYDKFVFKANNIKSVVTCPIHGDFLITPDKHLNGHGCPKCAGQGFSTKEWIDRFRSVHGDRYNYDKFVYRGNNIKSIVTCPEHGDFLVTPANHLQGKRGCPKCKQSKGEIQIENYLKQNNIKYEIQKKFAGCKHKLPLPFDFYLPDYNILIEFQGIQHYKSVKHFGGEKKFKQNQKRDQIKREFCSKKENPSLIEIKYTEINNINEILNKIINI